jgi:heavy metal sensor kinase
MRSIRLSLVVYCLVLLAVSLGAVSTLVYRLSEQNLRDKQKAMSDLLVTKHQAKLDERLLQEARALRHTVKVQAHRRNDEELPPYWLGILSAPLAPAGPAAIGLWGLQAIPDEEEHPNNLRFFQGVIAGPKFKLKNMVIPLAADQLTEFVQITNGQSATGNGLEWRSPAMGKRSLPFNPKAFAGPRPVEETFDDTSLGGIPVRRVTLKVPFYRIDRPGGERKSRFPFVPPHQWPGRIKWARRPPPPIFIECAYDKSRTDGVLGLMSEELEQDKERLEQSTQETLHALGQNLLALTLTTFAVGLVGVLFLVRLGLSPMRRLSDAVSRISAKDFRLPLDDKRMPAELQPIVGRLEQTLDQLKRAFAREKHAAADISHELRTPLAALLTTIEVALRKPRPAEEYREVLEEARASGQHMYGLVERLLTLARLDAGADHLRTREVDVSSLAEQCASLVRPLAEARGLHLDVHTDGPACVKGDPDKLREVFTNLLHNAIEYNRPDGSIDVAVQSDNGDVRVEVRDTGIGISPEARRLIFERFYRADPSRAAEGLHAGLGLAIVKGYVDLMGGKIDVDSKEGQGSTFRLRLPVQPAAHG